MAAHVWGIDLGGTKIEGVIIDPDLPDKPIVRLRVPTEADQGYPHICDQMRKLVDLMSKESGEPIPKKIGIGAPGAIEPRNGRLKNSNTQCLNGQPLCDDLNKKLGAECVIVNDANCLALAEATLGSARGYDTVYGVILGTGVGAGIVVDGKVLNGAHGIAGEWGQIILDPKGPPSSYGTLGTVEAFIAGPGLEKFYAEQSGTKRKLKEIVERAKAGDDPHATATINRLTDKFSDAISIIINVLDPHAIVLGGGVGNIDALYEPETLEKIKAKIFNPTFDAALLRPTLGDSAGVFGAAMLVR